MGFNILGEEKLNQTKRSNTTFSHLTALLQDLQDLFFTLSLKKKGHKVNGERHEERNMELCRTSVFVLEFRVSN